MRPILSRFHPEQSSSRRGERKNLPSRLSHCQRLLRKGKGADALAAAREGLRRYPHSRDLQDILRATWKRESSSETSHLRQAAHQSGDEPRWEEFLVHLIDHGDLDAAGREARSLLESAPEMAWAHFLHGAVFAYRFAREQVARDGAAALRSLETAVELDSTHTEASLLLAETLDGLGAPTRALFHLYQAQDHNPDAGDVRTLIEELSMKTPESDSEGDLLRRAEERVAASELVALEDEAIVSDAQRLASSDAVGRVVALHDEGACVLDGESEETLRGQAAGEFMELANGFRRSASLSAKRMGIGSFQEAELRWQGGGLLALNGGNSALCIELDGSARNEDIASEARRTVATWSATEGATR